MQKRDNKRATVFLSKDVFLVALSTCMHVHVCVAVSVIIVFITLQNQSAPSQMTKLPSEK